MNSFCTTIGIEQPSYFESCPQGIAGNIEDIGNSLIGKAGMSQRFCFWNVDLCGEVMLSVGGAGKDNKVFNSVVGLYPIDMVDFLASLKAAPDIVFHDRPVLFDWFTGIADDDISGRVKMLSAALSDVFARPAAKMPSSVGGEPMLSVECNTTGVADALNNHAPSISQLGQVARVNENMLNSLERNGQPLPK